VGIHRLLNSSCCFLNTNTVITRQLTVTARTLEAEWWQVCREAWVRGQRKLSQVLGAFGMLHFTMSRPDLAWRAFLNLRNFQLRHPHCVDRVTIIDKCSQTQLLTIRVLIVVFDCIYQHL
jgi:hypothetical protein